MSDNIKRTPLGDFLKLNNCEGKAVYFATYPEQPEKNFVILERDNYDELVGFVKRISALDGRDVMMLELLSLVSEATHLKNKLGE